MKKFLYTVLALATVALVGCNQRAKDEVRVYPESAAAKVVALGALNGTWTCVDENGTTTGAGTVDFQACTVDSIIASAGADNVAMLHVNCADLSVDQIGVVNVMHAGDDIIFSNNKVASGFGAPVYGRVKHAYNGEAKVIVDFQIDKKVGRLTKSFVYHFE